ncbi:SagB/ThcOx family dehydrogenase [Rhodococcus sp. WS4]|nr:SagB/ThcOx family dehydrogenase [Rhodococcus sp. WS4]
MTKVKVAECAMLFWDDGKLVWDDYVRHRQFALTTDSERVIRWFSDWRELSSGAELGKHALSIAHRLLDARILIGEGSPEHAEQNRILAEWGTWGPAPRYHHFASRTDERVRYASVSEEELDAAAKVGTGPPPEPAKTYPRHELVPLPAGRPDSSEWPTRDFVEVLYSRRSTRHFTDEPVTLDALGSVVRAAAGIVRTVDRPRIGRVHLKTSPSAGARTPIELYVYVKSSDALEPGLFHFAPTRGGLERLGPAVPDDVLRLAVGEQPWLANCSALIIYTAVLARTRWRYGHSRAYRDILVELGHVSQTVLLTAAALGLGAVTATAMRDDLIESILGCDLVAEPALAVTAIGNPAPEVMF